MKRVPALDGLRGIAILLVLLMHGWRVRGGLLGVDLFFVLSGFLITGLLLSEHERTGAVSLRGFYRRRVKRLGPALAFMLLVCAAGAIAVGASPARQLIYTAVGVGYSANVLAILHPSLVAPYFGHLWSLAEEEQFYLLWPIVLIVCLRKRVGTGWIAIGLAVAAGLSALDEYWWSPPLWRYEMPDTHASPILIGCLAGVLFARGWRAPMWLAASGLAGAVAVFVSDSLSLSPVYLFPVFALGCAPLLMHVAEPSALGRVLAVRPLAFFGAISYALYLWNTITVDAIKGPHWIAILLAVGIACFSYRYVERRQRYSATIIGDVDAAPPLPPPGAARTKRVAVAPSVPPLAAVAMNGNDP